MRLRVLVFGAVACLPSPTVLVGRACDDTHGCGPELYCVANVCGVQPPDPVPDSGVDSGTPKSDGGNCLAEESACFNGLDDDCDGKIDCADPSCGSRACSATNPAAVCCGDAGCADLARDALHCGGCGIACGAGFACTAATAGAVRSGRCGCVMDVHCPQPGPTGLTQDQNCIMGGCKCDTVVECGTGQKCTAEEGLGQPGFCFYPPR